MPSSEEESQWLVGSGGGLAPSGGNATKTGAGERGATTRSGLYTEEMTTGQPANVATAGVNSASADSAEHDLIDSTADATLLAQFHEDAIKQVTPRRTDSPNYVSRRGDILSFQIDKRGYYRCRRADGIIVL